MFGSTSFFRPNPLPPAPPSSAIPVDPSPGEETKLSRSKGTKSITPAPSTMNTVVKTAAPSSQGGGNGRRNLTTKYRFPEAWILQALRSRYMVHNVGEERMAEMQNAAQEIVDAQIEEEERLGMQLGWHGGYLKRVAEMIVDERYAGRKLLFAKKK